MAAFTEAEIDAMKGAQLRAELEALGENKTEIGKKRVAVLKAMLKQKCGITQTAAQNRNNSGGNNQTAAQLSAPAQTTRNNSGGNNKKLDDLLQVLGNCGLPKTTATKLTTTQGINGLEDLKELTPEDMEPTISRHNKAMNGANEAFRIFSTVVIKKLSALVHSVRVFALTGTEFTLNDWMYDVQIRRGMQELEMFQAEEKNATEAKPLKEVVSAEELLKEKPHEVFDLVITNLGQRNSAHGCGAKLAYVVGNAMATTTNLVNPSLAERLEQGLPRSGDAYNKDNTTVFEALEEWAQDEKIYDHIKPYKRDKDGRSAFLALKAIYLGKSSADSALIKAQGAVSDGQEGLVYHGEVAAASTGMPWSTYVGKLNSNYDVIEQHSGDTISQKSRVLRLMRGIKGDAAQQQIIIIACETVKDSTTYSNSYQKAASYLQLKIQGVYASAIANRSKNQTQTVNETNTDQSGHDGGGRGDQYVPWYGGRGGRGHGRGGGGRGQPWGGRGRGRGRGVFTPNPHYNGQTEHKEIAGIDVSDVWKDFDRSVFYGAVRTYVRNRRNYLRSQGIYGNKGNSMKVSEASTKRNGEGDNNPNDGKKSRAGEDNDYQKMHAKE